MESDPRSQTVNKFAPLKIGFLSDGFRRSPSGLYGHLPTLENLPEDQFELVAYTTNDYEDDITKRIMQVVNKWLPVARFSAKELEKQIKADKIDILIDLAGHMSGSRMQNNCHETCAYYHEMGWWTD